MFDAWRTQRAIKRTLKNCDYFLACYEVTTRLEGKVVPNALVPLLDAFGENPCETTARALIEYDLQMLHYFAASDREAATKRFMLGFKPYHTPMHEAMRKKLRNST